MDFVLKSIKTMEEMGENVSYKGKIKNVGKTIRRFKEEYTHIVILGSNEENGDDIKIKSIENDSVITIESPNKKIKKQDVEERY